MSEHDAVAMRRLRTDDRPLWDVMLGVCGYPAMLVAHELKLLELLAETPLSLDEICVAKGIVRRPAETLLAVCTSLGLIALTEGRYALTPLSEDYLLPSSPTYFGWFYDAWRPIYSIWSPDSLRDAVMTDHPQGPFSDPAGASAAWWAEQAANFTRTMHSASIGPALAWPEGLDLSRHRVMLDVGRGSGAHAIGAVNHWPDLRAVVLDQPPICALVRAFAAQYGLSGRISIHSADCFRDPFPPPDLHFYGMIFHD